MTVASTPLPMLASLAEPSASQRAAIEAGPHSLLVLAGPGAGKTYCLIERIRFLIEHHGFDPGRICAFTFTNKAAGEIEHRLEARLGAPASRITRGTIHAFCADLLRKHGTLVGLDAGFGIADDEYQRSVLRRLEGPRRWHKNTLSRFSAYRFRGDALFHDDMALFDRYERYLADRNVVDFDTLVIKAAELLERADISRDIRAQWDVVLVDEFQDLNPVQYRVVKALARDHKHVFGVGDDEQSIYSWAGADPKGFLNFLNDLELRPERIHLEENHRCPSDVFASARALVALNPQIFTDRVTPRAGRVPVFPVDVVGFETDDAESAWLMADIQRDREEHKLRWGDIALLYRKHDIGDHLEAAFLNAGIPCRLAQGRALADDPIVAYVIAATRVIARPGDDICRDAFFEQVLPRPLFDEARAKAEESQGNLRLQLRRMSTKMPRGDDAARQIRRALADWKNLEAVAKQHASIGTLVQELLSRRVGKLRSILDDRHDEITDPAGLPEVARLAERLREARDRRVEVWVPPMKGMEIPIWSMLTDIGVKAVRGKRPGDAAVCLAADECPSVGLPLGVFKAAQLMEMTDTALAFTNFTAVDLETTDRDVRTSEIVEIAAVRVRDGKITETYHSLVRPRGPISAGAMATHHITEADVAGSPGIEAVWPAFRAFCGEDVIVAHNGYEFDFRILVRIAKELGAKFDLCTFDTLPLARDLFPTSRKLVDLCRHFGIETGQSHRALDDTKALALVLLELGKMKISRARKTALVELLGHLGIALALDTADALSSEALLFRNMCVVFSLGKYSGAIESYEKEVGDDITLPGAEEVIELLGGADLMVKIRTVKSADERYPAAMGRLRRLIAEIPDGALADQLSLFLERVVLSRWDGDEPDQARVNLLTLHSTKGLEFSRVYIVGAEDAQLPGGSPTKVQKTEEVEEARRLLYVGMTRTVDRLVLTNVATRGDKPTGGHRFLDEMSLKPRTP
ncbi:MAG: UvrD-helicase domain-containing protein [bacterium]